MKALIDARAVAERLNVSDKAIYAIARAGLIPHVRVGRSVRFDPDAIEAFIASGGKSYPGGWRREQSEARQ